jgi:hypothetical protein
LSRSRGDGLQKHCAIVISAIQIGVVKIKNCGAS